MSLALVVDDDPVTRLVLCHMLRSRGWTVSQAADAPDAVGMVGETPYDLVISDFHLPSGTGVDVLDAVERAESSPAFLLVTGILEHSSLSAEIASRITAQLTKPVSSEDLGAALDVLFPPKRE
ncbi:Response regulator receiver domain-containing protein [Agreia bicolorata]|uniref:Response regulator receiver domain-containing protein n=1 Tax=Agreia bicolorata TaxID=110935 RepID=A0A1T4XZ53_9MICO|nr:response regulator [Agreia bicolorata]KJC63837.1 hypothetical protein TZ00_12465 [Agreia bicolorata]SKA94508.1 Response regulator receiver domain-containing protein [Agreia bicolorata]